jgi:hypothetical protein
MNLSELGMLEVRAFISAGLFFLSICLVLVFGRLLVIEVRHFGWKAVRSNPVNQAAIALMVYFLGMIFTRGWSALLYNIMANGGSVIPLENSYPVAIVSAAVAAVGGLCCIRVFTRNRWTWIVAGIVVAALTAITTVVL